MDTETKILRQDLEIAQENLKAVTIKCRSMVYELENCTNYDAEKTLRGRQLSRILRALQVLEAQLKQEQKTIQRLLQEKDNIIQAQQLEIAKLRRYAKKYCKVKRDFSQQLKDNELEATRFQHKNDILFDPNQGDKCDYECLKYVSGEKYNFAGDDISKTSLTSREVADISNSSDNSAFLLSTERFCERENNVVSPDSVFNKIDRFVAKENINEHDSRTEDKYDLMFNGKKNVVKARVDEFSDLISQDTSKNKTYADDEIIINNQKNEPNDEQKNGLAEPIYENVHVGEYISDVKDKCNNNVTRRILKPHSEKQIQEESTSHWYNDPDEDRNHDDVFQNTIYQSNSNHNSVLECVNQILLRDMEEEENLRVTSRRYKYKGKVVCFQTAKLSDIESVGSEVERRNSEDMIDDKPSSTSSRSPEKTNFSVKKLEDDMETQLKVEAAQIIHDESEKNDSLIGDSEEAKALVIIEPEEQPEEKVIEVEPEVKFVSCLPRNETKVAEKLSLPVIPKRLTIAKNLDYEEIESLSSETSIEKTPTQKPQFRNNTLILKKIPSPSFLIDESHKKYPKKSSNLACKNFYEETPRKNQLIFCQPLVQQFKEELRNQKSSSSDDNSSENSIRGNGLFEEFKIEENEGLSSREKQFPEVYDVQQNFEEFKLDECDLSDDLNRLEADGSEVQIKNNTTLSVTPESKINQFNSCYDSFLEASGMSNKCILTPSRLISNHKSMLKPKDIKYKRKIKSNGTIYEGQDIIGVSPMYNTKHWTGPFV